MSPASIVPLTGMMEKVLMGLGARCFIKLPRSAMLELVKCITISLENEKEAFTNDDGFTEND